MYIYIYHITLLINDTYIANFSIYIYIYIQYSLATPILATDMHAAKHDFGNNSKRITDNIQGIA